MIFGISLLFSIQVGTSLGNFGVGIFYDLSVWSNELLPPARELSLGSTTVLIPYEYYFDGNELFNITEKVCDLSEENLIGMITLTSCKKAAFLRHQINSLFLPNVIVTAEGEPCDLSLSSSPLQTLMVYPDCRLLNKAFVSIASHKTWRSINLIYDESYGKLCMNALADQFSRLSVSLVTIYISEDNNIETSLSSLNNGNETRIFTILNPNRTRVLIRQAVIRTKTWDFRHLCILATTFSMFRRHLYWVIYANPNNTGIDDVITDLDNGHVLTLFFSWNFSDVIVEDIISAFGHTLVFMINQNATYSSGKYNCNDKKPTPAGSKLLQMLTQNLTIGPFGKLKWTSDGVLDHTVHIQSTTAGKKGSFTEVATYNYTEGFRIFDDRLFLNLFNDFGNRTLTVVSWTSTPFTIREKTRNNQTHYRGFCYDILDEFAKVFNFRYVIKDSIDGTYGGPTDDGKNGTGMVGMVMRGEADIGVGPFTVTAARETVVDFLTPFQEEGVGIIMRTVDQKTGQMFRMFFPFQSTSWIATGVSIVFTGAILFVVSRCSPYTSNSDKPLHTNVWLAFGAFFGQLGGDTTPKSASGRLVLGIWWMCTILILEFYTANLAAFLTIPPAKSPIKNLEELAASPDYKPLVKSGSNLEFLFKRAKGGLYRQIRDRMDDMPVITTTEEGYELVHQGQYAYMTDVSQLTYKVLTDCHNLLVSEETFNKAGLSFIVQENADFKSAFNFHMIRMIEAGLIAKYHSKWWPKLSQCGEDLTQTATELHIDSMAGIFIVYAAFIGLSTLFFISEIILHRIIYRQKEKKIKSADMMD